MEFKKEAKTIWFLNTFKIFIRPSKYFYQSEVVPINTDKINTAFHPYSITNTIQTPGDLEPGANYYNVHLISSYS